LKNNKINQNNIVSLRKVINTIAIFAKSQTIAGIVALKTKKLRRLYVTCATQMDINNSVAPNKKSELTRANRRRPIEKRS
jgi:hypothetical protein